jgi:phosphate transport system protein
VNRAQKVIARDEAVNSMEIEIDEMTRTILALRQPAASDPGSPLAGSQSA